MDTYELLWKFWNNNVPKKYVAKELLSLGKPMEVYFAKEEFHTKPELTLMSKRNFDRIIVEVSDIEFEVEYDEDFLKDLIELLYYIQVFLMGKNMMNIEELKEGKLI